MSRPLPNPEAAKRSPLSFDRLPSFAMFVLVPVVLRRASDLSKPTLSPASMKPAWFGGVLRNIDGVAKQRGVTWPHLREAYTSKRSSSFSDRLAILSCCERRAAAVSYRIRARSRFAACCAK